MARVGIHPDGGRLRRLQSLTDAALAHLELEPLLAALLERTREMLQADTCAILLLDKQTNELVARAAVGIEEEVEAGVRVPLGSGFAGRVAAERRPVVIDDVDHAEVSNPILREKGIKSLLGVPLLVAGHALGVLHVGMLEPRKFDQEDIDLLQLAADRAAIAIEHARLFEAEQAARLRLERVQAVTDAALAHLDVDDLLAVLLPLIRDMLRADTCAVLLLDEDADELVARAALGIEEEVEAGVRIPVGGGFAGVVASTKAPAVLPAIDASHVLNPILIQKGLTSLAGVPLLVRGEAIGVLHVGTLTPRAFSADDIDMLEIVAERVAIAVERAQLHEQTVLLDQLKLNFVAVASHELRTPATAVYGALATLRELTVPAEMREELLDMAFEQADRLRRLLEQLLDLSRLDARGINVDPKPLVLHSVLQKIAGDALPEGTTLELEVDPDFAVVADPLVLDRILSNLLINAWRYGEQPIVLSAEQKDRHLRIGVEDAGSGVPEELQTHLFDRFTRGEQAGGSGLGLAIALAYARAHGGDLVYEHHPASPRFVLIVPQG
ncbi:MAG TPA: GAF domain-containing protein [Gaiellaceae bacterium]|jgi:K+-sensing histidine kinase KdpD